MNKKKIYHTLCETCNKLPLTNHEVCEDDDEPIRLITRPYNSLFMRVCVFY